MGTNALEEGFKRLYAYTLMIDCQYFRVNLDNQRHPGRKLREHTGPRGEACGIVHSLRCSHRTPLVSICKTFDCHGQIWTTDGLFVIIFGKTQPHCTLRLVLPCPTLRWRAQHVLVLSFFTHASNYRYVYRPFHRHETRPRPAFTRHPSFAPGDINSLFASSQLRKVDNNDDNVGSRSVKQTPAKGLRRSDGCLVELSTIWAGSKLAGGLSSADSLRLHTGYASPTATGGVDDEAGGVDLVYLAACIYLDLLATT